MIIYLILLESLFILSLSNFKLTYYKSILKYQIKYLTFYFLMFQLQIWKSNKDSSIKFFE